MNPIDWEQALLEFRAKHRTEEALYPYWLEEVSRIIGLNIRQHGEQAIPLFENGWGPNDAADHLRRVWAIKAATRPDWISNTKGLPIADQL